jgi:hypothetical protein
MQEQIEQTFYRKVMQGHKPNGSMVVALPKLYTELAKLTAGNTVNMNILWVEGEPVLMTRKEIS